MEVLLLSLESEARANTNQMQNTVTSLARSVTSSRSKRNKWGQPVGGTVYAGFELQLVERSATGLAPASPPPENVNLSPELRSKRAICLQFGTGRHASSSAETLPESTDTHSLHILVMITVLSRALFLC